MLHVRLHVALLASTALLLTSCGSLPSLGDLVPFGGDGPSAQVRESAGGPTAANDRMSGWSAAGPGSAQPVLYGRDGTPVGRTQPGQVIRTEEPINEGVATDGGGSRGVLLELYKEVVAERDELLEQVMALGAQDDLNTTTIEQHERRIAELEAQVAALTTRNGELETQVFDVSARLTQAQIGRLEAERALLEASLEWRRMNASNSAAASEGQ